MVNDRITYSLENAGLSLSVKADIPDEYFKAAGMSGSGLAPTTLTINDSIGGGGRWRASRRGVRTLDFPLYIFGNGRADIEAKLVKLVAVFNDRFSTPKLVATYPDGRQYEIEFHYSSGADHEWGTDTDGRNWVKWPLSLVCPDPYWTARKSTQFDFTTGGGGRGLLRAGASLSQMRLTTSQALGSISVTNAGDVDAYPVWELVGPASGFTAVRVADGAKLSYNGIIPQGGRVFLDTQYKTAFDDNDINVYESMGLAPKFFALLPGQSEIVVVLAGASTGSTARLTYRERREFLF